MSLKRIARSPVRAVALAAWLAAQDGGGGGGGGGGSQTLLASKRLGGQITTLIDGSPDAITQDIIKRVRNFSPIIGSPHQYQNARTPLRVQSLTRSSNVVSVVLSEAPAVTWPLQNIRTGYRLVMTCNTDATFDVDHVAITVTDQTHFTYPCSGADGSANVVSQWDCGATAINQVAVGAAGHPIEDFYAILSSSAGSPTSMPDLDGTYVGFFPGSLPTGLALDNGGSVSFTPGNPTFSLTLATNDSSSGLSFTGVPNDGSFRLPRIIRNDHDTSGATYARPDFVQYLQRFGALRFLDGGMANYNSFIKSSAKRPLFPCGYGMPVEDMVDLCNQVGCDMYYVLPHWVTDEYATAVLTVIRDRLLPGLKLTVEYDNEPWNAGALEIVSWHWNLSKVSKDTKGVFHGYDGRSEITGITRSGTTVTVAMNHPPPFASSSSIILRITGGADEGGSFDTATPVTATVSGNNFSFTLAGAGTTASFTSVAVFGDLSNNLLNDQRYDPNALVGRRHAKRTYEIAQLLSAVFGGLNGRARMVLMWQSADATQFGHMSNFMLPWLQATYGQVSDWLYAIGGAPYAIAAGTTTAQVKASVIADVDSEHLAKVHYYSYLAKKYNVKHVQYEGHVEVSDLGTSLIDSLYSSNDMRDADKYLIDMMFAHGVDEHFVYHTSMQAPGINGTSVWGIGRTLAADGGPIGVATSKRVQAIDNALQAAVPANADVNTLPGTLYFQGGPSYKDDLYLTGLTNGMRRLWNSTYYVESGFYVAEDDTDIELTVIGGVVVGGGSAAARVFVDGTLAGSVNMATTGALTSLPSGGSDSTTTLTVTLDEGYHYVKVMPPTSTPDEFGVSAVDGAIA